jgi:PII-like signaling protein
VQRLREHWNEGTVGAGAYGFSTRATMSKEDSPQLVMELPVCLFEKE